jgi:hypothetical protein
MLSKTLVLLLLGVTFATSQLTASDQASLTRLAKNQITKLLGHSGDFADPHADLESVVQAS